MSNKFNLLAVLSLYLAGTNVVYALSCKTGDSSCSTKSAADCSKLGYSADNVDNCKHYLYCPFNQSYKTCVAFCSDEHCKAWSSELEDCECTECEDFYEKKNGKCVPMTCDDNNETADDCKDTETYVVDKTLLNNEVCGHCVDCADENDPNSPCKGYYTCSGGGRSPKGDVKCTCGNVNYYEDCEVIETCFIESYSNCSDNYSDKSSGDYNNYWYLIGEKCTTLNNKKIYTWALCDEEINCLGPSITYGLERCDYDYGIGEPVKCGGLKYFQKCNECYTSSKEKYEGDAVSADSLQWALSHGSYLIKKLCTEDNVTMYLTKSCKGYTKDYPAFGLQTCEGDQGSGKTVECGGLKWFEKCDETCYATSSTSYCKEDEDTDPDLNTTSLYDDYYLIGTKCTKLDGKTKVYQYADCATTKKDCNGNQSPAYGMQACEDGDGIGTAVKCGSKKYYKQCGGCDSTLSSSSYPGCHGATTDLNYWTLNHGDYIAGEKCTKVDGSKVYLIADCTVKKDCKGNKGPAYGLKTCPSGYYHTGTVKECGGKIYASDCAVSCKYEQKESDCTDGETFTPYCLDANRVWYGECK